MALLNSPSGLGEARLGLPAECDTFLELPLVHSAHGAQHGHLGRRAAHVVSRPRLQALLDAAEKRGYGLLGSGGDSHPGLGHGQPRLRHGVDGQGLEPAAQRDQLAVGEHLLRRLLDELRGYLQVTGRQGVAHRVGGQAVFGKPGSSAAVEGGHSVWLGLRQVAAQELGKEVVVAVPVPLLVERDDEEVGLFQLLEGALPRPSPGSRRYAHHCIAKQPAQPVEDSGL